MAYLSADTDELFASANGRKSSNAPSGPNSDAESDELLHSMDYHLRSTSRSSLDLSEGEEAIRRKLKWYFMNPYQKFKEKGRKPWKLLLQVVKIILVTVQAIQFAIDHFAVVSYNSDSIQAFRYYFIQNYDGIASNHDVYTKADLYGHMFHVWKQYYNISGAVGPFVPIRVNGEPKPISVCAQRIQRSYYLNGIDPQDDETLTNNCSTLLPPSSNITDVHSFVSLNGIPTDFTWVETVTFHFLTKSINLKEFEPEDVPDCYTFNLTILFDNSDQDAVFQLYLLCQSTFSHCKTADVDSSSANKSLKPLILLLDFVVIISCSISCILCCRSLIGHMRLCKETRRFFKEYRHDKFSLSDTMNFVSFWICLTLLNDVFAITGSVLKIMIDQSGFALYDVCSIFLGASTVFSWIGVLRYLGYSKDYNVLLVTLKVAFPTVIRFILCAAFIYVGFLFCGWIVFGPYHDKFKSLSVTSECLFSLINGDDMFTTFSKMDNSNLAIFVFSKIYLYAFISLFIFCVNSLFIAIICDTYERIKDYGYAPKTRVELFMEGKEYDYAYVNSRGVNDSPIPDGNFAEDIHDGDAEFSDPRGKRRSQRWYRTFPR